MQPKLKRLTVAEAVIFGVLQESVSCKSKVVLDDVDCSRGL